MKRFLMILGVFLLFSDYILNAQSRWIFYRKDPKGNFHYYDINSMNWIEDDIVEVWKKTIYSEKGRNEWIENLIKWGIPIEKAKKLYKCNVWYRIDVKNKKLKILKSVYYDEEGDVISSSEYPEVLSDWSSIVPDSIGELIWQEMSEFQEIGVIKKIIKKNPENPIHYYLLGRKYEFLSYYYLSFSVLEIEEKNEFSKSEKTMRQLAAIYFMDAFNRTDIKTFPFEMVKIKNANFQKEDISKILKSYFLYEYYSNIYTPLPNKLFLSLTHIKTIEDSIKVWEDKSKKIPFELNISIIADPLTENKTFDVFIDLDMLFSLLISAYYGEENIEKVCECFYRYGVYLLEN